MADGASVAAAAAAAVSAAFAGLSTLAAWLTVRSRRPKLKVEYIVGRSMPGYVVQDPQGDHLAVRIRNLRDAAVQVTLLVVEPKLSRWRRLRGEGPRSGFAPAPQAFIGRYADLPTPFTLDGQHARQLQLRPASLLDACDNSQWSRFRFRVEVAGRGGFHSRWFTTQDLGQLPARLDGEIS